MQTFVCSAKFFTKNGIITSKEATVVALDTLHADSQFSAIKLAYRREYNEENPENPIFRFSDTTFAIPQ